MAAAADGADGATERLRRFELPPKQLSSGGAVAVAVLGDLHLEPAQMPLFHEAREQLLRAMMGDAAASSAPAAPNNANGDRAAPPSPPSSSPSSAAAPTLTRVVQLGDLTGYHHGPGNRSSFEEAREYLDGFGAAGAPAVVITGNHDLEGSEFDADDAAAADAANLAAWRDVFRQPHHWAARLGPALAVGLSTVRFRSNAHSVHEVFVDGAQLDWFERVLEQNPDVPTLVFTHAPPAGCGLKVVQHVHVKNRCAYLNHSGAGPTRPGRFMEVLQRHPQVKLWFSGHYHLSQTYVDSISVVGGCAFVQTGVIGECHRDGRRQSRLLRLDADGYGLYTVDHGRGGELTLDLEHGWRSHEPPAPVAREGAAAAGAEGGWLRSELDCALPSPAPAGGGQQLRPPVRWLSAGPNRLLAVQDDLVVEYDMALRSPVGVVAFLEGRKRVLGLVTAAGAPPAADGDGSDAAALLLEDPSPPGAEGGAAPAVERVERNADGGFYRVWQKNKWRAKKEAAAAAGGGGARAAEEARVVAA